MFFKETGYNCLDLTYSTHHCCLAEGVLTPLSPPTNPLIECLSMAIYPKHFSRFPCQFAITQVCSWESSMLTTRPQDLTQKSLVHFLNFYKKDYGSLFSFLQKSCTVYKLRS